MRNSFTYGFTPRSVTKLILFAAYVIVLAVGYAVWLKCRAGKVSIKNFRRSLISVFLFSLLWAAVISLLDQSSYSNVTVYISMLFVFSVAFLFKPKEFLAVQTPVLICFFIALPFFQEDFSVVRGHIINILICFVLAVIASNLVYSSTLESIINKRLIETKNAELNELVLKLKELSTIDFLTTVYNRRVFDETLETEWRRASRTNASMALILLDVDHFKKYNDTYGHIKGDECLAKIGEALKNSFKRANEFVARYGGEEFAVIIANCGREEGILACNRLIQAVDSLNIPHGQSETGMVAVSAGLAVTVPKPSDKLEDFIMKADNALYDSKNSGRHRFGVAAQ